MLLLTEKEKQDAEKAKKEAFLAMEKAEKAKEMAFKKQLEAEQAKLNYFNFMLERKLTHSNFFLFLQLHIKGGSGALHFFTFKNLKI